VVPSVRKTIRKLSPAVSPSGVLMLISYGSATRSEHEPKHRRRQGKPSCLGEHHGSPVRGVFWSAGCNSEDPFAPTAPRRTSGGWPGRDQGRERLLLTSQRNSCQVITAHNPEARKRRVAGAKSSCPGGPGRRLGHRSHPAVHAAGLRREPERFLPAPRTTLRATSANRAADPPTHDAPG